MKNNALWVCRQSSTCHFSCYEKQSNKNLYTGAVEAFLNTGQSIPLCCIRKDGERNYAKIKVVTDIKKENYGRPFFICSKGFNPCSYFEWGDKKIPEVPLCEHEQPSRMFTVKKGQNKDRSFFRCRERDTEKRCKFFKWSEDMDAPNIQQTHTAFLSAENPSLFGSNFDAHKKELLEKRFSSPLEQHHVSSSTDESKAETFVRKRKIPILSE